MTTASPKPLPIHFDYAFASETVRTQGWIVPDTNDTLAVDERWGNHWRLTHIPSGRGVMPPDNAELTTRGQAMGFARRFYKEAVALGADLTSKDWETIRGLLFYDIGHGERAAFWSRVI